MNVAILALGFIIGAAVAYWAVTRVPKPKYLAMAEYWVYLPTDKLPVLDEMMNLMLRDNPYHRRGVSPIGAPEGLVFSDIRFHVALALRAKNPHIFRPDLFETHIDVTHDELDALQSSVSIAKLRYVSDTPLKDKRHLQFLIHAADAIAELGGSQVIYDVQAEKLLSRSELQQVLKENFDATGFEIHTRVVWKQTAASASAETRGLIKIGLPEVRTAKMEPDQRVIATNIMNETIRTLWDSQTVPESVDVSAFGDTFKVVFEPIKNKMFTVRILRVQAT